MSHEKITSKVETARKNVENARTVHRRANYLGVDDEAFKAVTNLIISLMDSVDNATTQIDERLQELRAADSDPRFLRYLGATDLMADNALANSKLAMEQIEKVANSARDAARGSN